MHFGAKSLCLAVFFCSYCFGQVDGLNTTAAPPRMVLPSHIKLVEGFVSTGKRTSAETPKPARTPATGPVAQTESRCAHIVVIPAPRDLDRQMIIPVPEQGKIVTHKGMPACSSVGK